MEIFSLQIEIERSMSNEIGLFVNSLCRVLIDVGPLILQLGVRSGSEALNEN